MVKRVVKCIVHQFECWKLAKCWPIGFCQSFYNKMADRVLKRAMDQRRIHVFFLYEFKLGAVKAEHLYKYTY